MEDRYGLSATFDFNPGTSLSGLSQVSSSIRGLIGELEKLADTAESGAKDFDRGIKGFGSGGQLKKTAKQVDELGESFKDVKKSIAPLKDEFRALKAEARNIDFGNIGSDKSFKAGTKALKAYGAELTKIGDQIKGTTTLEREFAAAIKSQQRAIEMKQSAAKSSRDAFVAAEKKGIADAAKTIGGAGLSPIKSFAEKGISLAAEFDDKMAGLKSVAAPTEKQAAMLRKKAADLGASTRYTASEAGESMKLLAMAGLSINETMIAVGDTLSLASAGELGLAEAADVAAKTMSGLGLEVKELSHLTDVLARVANTTNSGVSDLGVAMGYAAPNAKLFGASLEETAALIGVMSNAGIVSDKAGTSLRQTFLRLAEEPKAGQAALAELNLQIADVNTGKMRNIIDILDDVRSKLGINAEDLTKSTGFITAIENAGGTEEDIDKAIEEMLKKGDKQARQISKLKALFGTTAVSGVASAINQLSEAKSVAFSGMAASFSDDAIKASIAAVTKDNERFAELGRLARSTNAKDREAFAKLDVFQYVADNANTYRDGVGIMEQASKRVSAIAASKLGGAELEAVKDFLTTQKEEDAKFGKRFEGIDFSRMGSGADVLLALESRAKTTKDATLDLATAMRGAGVEMAELRGSAKNTATVMEDSLGGDFRSLSSAVEAIYINLLEPIRPLLRSIVQGLTKLSLALANLPGPVRAIIAVAGLLVGAFALVLLAAGSIGVLVFGFQQAAATAALAMTAIEKTILPMTGFYETAMLAAAGTNPFNTQLKTLQKTANSTIEPLRRAGLEVQKFGSSSLAMLTSPMGLTILGFAALFFALDALTPQINLVGALLSALVAPFGFVLGFAKGLASVAWDLITPLIGLGATVAGFPIQDLTTGIEQAMAAFAQFVSQGETLGRKLGEFLTYPIVFAATTISSIWNKTIDFIINKLGVFLTVAGAVGQMLVSALAENSPGPTFLIRLLWELTTSALILLAVKLVKHFGGAGASLSTIFSDSFASISTVATSAIGSVTTTISNAWDQTINFITDKLGVFLSAARDVGQMLVSALAENSPGPTFLIRSLWDSTVVHLLSLLQGLVDYAWGIGGSLADAIGGVFASVSEGVNSVLSKPIDYIKQKIDGLVDYLADKFQFSKELMEVFNQPISISFNRASFEENVGKIGLIFAYIGKTLIPGLFDILVSGVFTYLAQGFRGAFKLLAGEKIELPQGVKQAGGGGSPVEGESQYAKLRRTVAEDQNQLLAKSIDLVREGLQADHDRNVGLKEGLESASNGYERLWVRMKFFALGVANLFMTVKGFIQTVLLLTLNSLSNLFLVLGAEFSLIARAAVKTMTGLVAISAGFFWGIYLAAANTFDLIVGLLASLNLLPWIQEQSRLLSSALIPNFDEAGVFDKIATVKEAIASIKSFGKNLAEPFIGLLNIINNLTDKLGENINFLNLIVLIISTMPLGLLGAGLFRLAPAMVTGEFIAGIRPIYVALAKLLPVLVATVIAQGFGTALQSAMLNFLLGAATFIKDSLGSVLDWYDIMNRETFETEVAKFRDDIMGLWGVVEGFKNQVGKLLSGEIGNEFLDASREFVKRMSEAFGLVDFAVKIIYQLLSIDFVGGFSIIDILGINLAIRAFQGLVLFFKTSEFKAMVEGTKTLFSALTDISAGFLGIAKSASGSIFASIGSSFGLLFEPLRNQFGTFRAMFLAFVEQNLPELYKGIASIPGRIAEMSASIGSGATKAAKEAIDISGEIVKFLMKLPYGEKILVPIFLAIKAITTAYRSATKFLLSLSKQVLGILIEMLSPEKFLAHLGSIGTGLSKIFQVASGLVRYFVMEIGRDIVSATSFLLNFNKIYRETKGFLTKGIRAITPLDIGLGLKAGLDSEMEGILLQKLKVLMGRPELRVRTIESAIAAMGWFQKIQYLLPAMLSYVGSMAIIAVGMFPVLKTLIRYLLDYALTWHTLKNIVIVVGLVIWNTLKGLGHGLLWLTTLIPGIGGLIKGWLEPVKEVTGDAKGLMETISELPKSLYKSIQSFDPKAAFMSILKFFWEIPGNIVKAVQAGLTEIMALPGQIAKLASDFGDAFKDIISTVAAGLLVMFFLFSVFGKEVRSIFGSMFKGIFSPLIEAGNFFANIFKSIAAPFILIAQATSKSQVEQDKYNTSIEKMNILLSQDRGGLGNAATSVAAGVLQKTPFGLGSDIQKYSGADLDQKTQGLLRRKELNALDEEIRNRAVWTLQRTRITAEGDKKLFRKREYSEAQIAAEMQRVYQDRKSVREAAFQASNRKELAVVNEKTLRAEAIKDLQSKNVAGEDLFGKHNEAQIIEAMERLRSDKTRMRGLSIGENLRQWSQDSGLGGAAALSSLSDADTRERFLAGEDIFTKEMVLQADKVNMYVKQLRSEIDQRAGVTRFGESMVGDAELTKAIWALVRRGSNDPVDADAVMDQINKTVGVGRRKDFNRPSDDIGLASSFVPTAKGATLLREMIQDVSPDFARQVRRGASLGEMFQQNEAMKSIPEEDTSAKLLAIAKAVQRVGLLAEMIDTSSGLSGVTGIDMTATQDIIGNRGTAPQGIEFASPYDPAKIRQFLEREIDGGNSAIAAYFANARGSGFLPESSSFLPQSAGSQAMDPSATAIGDLELAQAVLIAKIKDELSRSEGMLEDRLKLDPSINVTLTALKAADFAGFSRILTEMQGVSAIGEQAWQNQDWTILEQTDHSFSDLYESRESTVQAAQRFREAGYSIVDVLNILSSRFSEVQLDSLIFSPEALPNGGDPKEKAVYEAFSQLASESEDSRSQLLADIAGIERIDIKGRMKTASDILAEFGAIKGQIADGIMDFAHGILPTGKEIDEMFVRGVGVGRTTVNLKRIIPVPEPEIEKRNVKLLGMRTPLSYKRRLTEEEQRQKLIDQRKYAISSAVIPDTSQVDSARLAGSFASTFKSFVSAPAPDRDSLIDLVEKSLSISTGNYTNIVDEMGLKEDEKRSLLAQIRQALSSADTETDKKKVVSSAITEKLVRQLLIKANMGAEARRGEGAEDSFRQLMDGDNGLLAQLKQVRGQRGGIRENSETYKAILPRIEAMEIAGEPNMLIAALSKAMPRKTEETLDAYRARLEQSVISIERGTLEKLSAEVLVSISRATKKNIAQLIQPNLYPKLKKEDIGRANSLRQAELSRRITQRGYGTMEGFRQKATRQGLNLGDQQMQAINKGEFHKLEEKDAIKLGEMLSLTGKRGADAYVELSAELAAQTLLGNAANRYARSARAAAAGRNKAAIQLDLTTQVLKDRASSEIVRRRTISESAEREAQIIKMALARMSKGGGSSEKIDAMTGLPSLNSGEVLSTLGGRKTGAFATLIKLMESDKAAPEEGVFRKKLDDLIAGRFADAGEGQIWEIISSQLGLKLEQIRDLHKVDLRSYVSDLDDVEFLYKDLLNRSSGKKDKGYNKKASKKLKDSRMAGLIEIAFPGRRIDRVEPDEDIRGLVDKHVGDVFKVAGIDTNKLGITSENSGIPSVYHAIADSVMPATGSILDRLSAYKADEVNRTDDQREMISKFEKKLNSLVEKLKKQKAKGITDVGTLAEVNKLVANFNSESPELRSALKDVMGESNFENLRAIAKGETQVDLETRMPSIFGNLGDQKDFLTGLPEMKVSTEGSTDLFKLINQINDLTEGKILYNKKILEIQRDIRSGNFDFNKLEEIKSLVNSPAASKKLRDFDREIREKVAAGQFDRQAQTAFAASGDNAKYFDKKMAVDSRAAILQNKLRKGDLSSSTHKEAKNLFESIGAEVSYKDIKTGQEGTFEPARLEEIRNNVADLKSFFSTQELINRLGQLSATEVEKIGTDLQKEYTRIYAAKQSEGSNVAIPTQLIAELNKLKDGKSSQAVTSLVAKLVGKQRVSLESLTRTERDMLEAIAEHYNVSTDSLLSLDKVPKNFFTKLLSLGSVGLRKVKAEYANYQSSMRTSLGGLVKTSGLNYEEIVEFLKIQGLTTEQIQKMFVGTEGGIGRQLKTKKKAASELKYLTEKFVGEKGARSDQRIAWARGLEGKTTDQRMKAFLDDAASSMAAQGKTQKEIDKAMAVFQKGNRLMNALEQDLGLKEYIGLQADQMENIARLFGVEAEVLNKQYSSRGAIAQTIAFSLDMLKRTFDPAAVTKFLGGLLSGTRFGDKLSQISQDIIARRKGAMQPMGERFVSTIKSQIVDPLFGTLVNRFNGQTMAALNTTISLAGSFAGVLNKYFLGRIPGSEKLQASILDIETGLKKTRDRVTDDLSSFTTVGQRARAIYDGSFLKPVVQFLTGRQNLDMGFVDSLKGFGSSAIGVFRAQRAGDDEAVKSSLKDLSLKFLDLATKNPFSKFLQAQTRTLGKKMIAFGQERRKNTAATQVFTGGLKADGSRETVEELRAPFATLSILLGNFLVRKVSRPLRTGADMLLGFSKFALKGIDNLEAKIQGDLPGKVKAIYGSIRGVLAQKVLGTLTKLRSDVENNQAQTALQKARMKIYSVLISTIESVVGVFRSLESSIKGGLSGLLSKAMSLFRGIFGGLGQLVTRFRNRATAQVPTVRQSENPAAATMSVAERREQLSQRMYAQGRISLERLQRSAALSTLVDQPVQGPAMPPIQGPAMPPVQGAAMSPAEAPAAVTEAERLAVSMEQVNERIEENWEQTSNYIIKRLKHVALNAEKIGYWIQRYVSEGSPGPTSRIRSFYDLTASYAINKLREIASAAQRSGRVIETSLTMGVRPAARNIPAPRRRSGNNVVDNTNPVARQVPRPVLRQRNDQLNATQAGPARPARAMQQTRQAAVAAAASVQHVAAAESHVNTEATETISLFKRLQQQVHAVGVETRKSLNMKTATKGIVMMGAGMTATSFALQNFVSGASQSGAISEEAGQALNNLFQGFMIVSAAATLLGGLFTTIGGGLTSLLSLVVSIGAAVASPVALMVAGITAGVVALTLLLNELSKIYLHFDFVAKGMDFIGNALSGLTGGAAKAAVDVGGALEKNLAPAMSGINEKTISPLKDEMVKVLGYDAVNGVTSAWESGASSIKGAVVSAAQAPTETAPATQSSFQMPSFQMPSFQMPSMPSFQMPSMPSIDGVDGVEADDDASGKTFNGMKRINKIVQTMRLKNKDFFTFFSNKKNLVGAKKISGQFGDISDSVSEVGDASLSTQLGDVQDQMTGVTGVMTGSADWIKGAWSGMGQHITEGLQALPVTAGEVGTELINKLNHSPTEKIPAAWDIAGVRIENRLESLVPKAGEVADKIGGFFKNAFSGAAKTELPEIPEIAGATGASEALKAKSARRGFDPGGRNDSLLNRANKLDELVGQYKGLTKKMKDLNGFWNKMTGGSKVQIKALADQRREIVETLKVLTEQASRRTGDTLLDRLVVAGEDASLALSNLTSDIKVQLEPITTAWDDTWSYLENNGMAAGASAIFAHSLYEVSTGFNTLGSAFGTFGADATKAILSMDLPALTEASKVFVSTLGLGLGQIAKGFQDAAFGAMVFGVFSFSSIFSLTTVLAILGLGLLILTLRFGKIRDVIKGVWLVTQGTFDLIFSLLTGIWDIGSGVIHLFKSLKSALKGDFTEFKAALEEISAGWDKMAKGIGAAIEKIGEGFGLIKSGFQGVVDFLFESVINVFTGIGETIKKAFTDGGESLKGYLTEVGDYWQEVLVFWTGVAKQKFSEAFEGIASIVKMEFGGIADGFGVIIDGISGVLKTFGKDAVIVFTELAEPIFQVGEWIITEINNILGGFGANFDQITTAASWLSGEVARIFAGIGVGLFDNINLAIEGFKSDLLEMISTLTGFGDQIKGVFTGVGESIKSVFGGVFSRFRQDSAEVSEQVSQSLSDPAEKAEGRWARTTAFIGNLMGNLREDADTTGQEVLHSLAENSPGPTAMIRQRYSETVAHLQGCFEQLREGAAETGAAISGSFEGASNQVGSTVSSISSEIRRVVGAASTARAEETGANPQDQSSAVLTRAGRAIDVLSTGVEGASYLLQLFGATEAANAMQGVAFALSIIGMTLTSLTSIVTVFTAVWGWMTGAVGASIGAVLLPILPIILAVAAAIGLLYLAFQTNFLGFGDALRAVWDLLVAIWDGFVGIFAGIFNQIGTQINNISNTINGAISILLSPFKFLIDMTMGLLKQFGLISNATTGLGGPFQMLANVILLPFKILGAVIEFAIRVIGWLVQAAVVVGAVLVAFVAAPILLIVGALALLVGLIRLLVNNMISAFSGLYYFLSAPLNILYLLGQQIFWLFQVVLFTTFNELGSIFGSVWNEIVTAFKDIGGTLGFLFDTLILPFKMMFDFLIAGWESIFGKIKSGSGSFNPIVSIIKGVLFPIQVVATILTWIIKGISLLIRGVMLLGGVVVAVFLGPFYLIAGILTAIIGSIITIGKFFIDLGATILSALISPFVALKDKIMEAFAGVGEFFKNPIAFLFGPKETTPPATVGDKPAFAKGGYVNGPGTGVSDSIDARISNGEFVVNADSTRNNRPLLELLNAGVPAEEAIQLMQVAHPIASLPKPDTSISVERAKGSGNIDNDRPIEVHLHFGDIILSGASGKEAAEEFVQFLQEPELEAAIVRILRNQAEMLR